MYNGDMAVTPEHKIAQAKALLDAGNSQRWVAAEVGISEGTAKSVDQGVIKVPDAVRAQEQNSLDVRLTHAIDLFLRKAIELAENNKLGEGLKGALGMAVFIDKRNLLRGLPTERTEDMGRTTQEELDKALADHPALAKRLQAVVKPLL